jgi:hypothetical protein
MRRISKVTSYRPITTIVDLHDRDSKARCLRQFCGRICVCAELALVIGSRVSGLQIRHAVPRHCEPEL